MLLERLHRGLSWPVVLGEAPVTPEEAIRHDLETLRQVLQNIGKEEEARSVVTGLQDFFKAGETPQTVIRRATRVATSVRQVFVVTNDLLVRLYRDVGQVPYVGAEDLDPGEAYDQLLSYRESAKQSELLAQVKDLNAKLLAVVREMPQPNRKSLMILRDAAAAAYAGFGRLQKLMEQVVYLTKGRSHADIQQRVLAGEPEIAAIRQAKAAMAAQPLPPAEPVKPRGKTPEEIRRERMTRLDGVMQRLGWRSIEHRERLLNAALDKLPNGTDDEIIELTQELHDRGLVTRPDTPAERWEKRKKELLAKYPELR